MNALFETYRIVHKMVKFIIYKLPLSEPRKAWIAKNLSNLVPITKFMRGINIPNPIRFDGDLKLFFREDDVGDLGIINCILRGGYYEPEVVRIMKRTLPFGGTFVDCGAHMGYHSVIAAKVVGRKGRVFAFEPFDENYDLLIENIHLNNLQTIVVPVKKAIWNFDHTLKMQVPDRSSVSVKRAVNDSSEEKTVTVEAVSLDSFFGEEDIKVDLIKLDIEGAEREAFIGMKRIIRCNSELKVICEFNYNNLLAFDISPQEFFEPLLSEGVERWYILYPNKERAINIPEQLEELVRISRNRNLNLLGIRI